MTSPLLRAWSTLFAVAVVGFAAWCSWTGLHEHLRVPYFDDWQTLDTMFTTPFWAWVLSFQNIHHMATTLLTYWADYWLFGGTGNLLIVASIVCSTLAFGALVAGLTAAGERRTPVSVTALAFLGFTLFWGALHQSLLWRMSLVNPTTLLGFLPALACTLVLTLRRPTGTRRWLLVGGAMLAGAFAMLSFGVGLATWPAIVAVAVIGRAPWTTTAALVAGSALAVLGGTAGLDDSTSASGSYTLRVLLERPVDVAIFIPAFLGSAPARAVAGFVPLGPDAFYATCVACGVVELLGLAALLPWLWRHGAQVEPRALAGFGIMAFTGTAGAFAALVRAGIHEHLAIGARFGIWSALFVGGLGVTASAVGGRAPGRRFTAGVCIGLPLVALVAAHSVDGLLVEHRARQRGMVRPALRVMLGLESSRGAPALGMLDADVLHRVATHLRADERGLFADPATRMLGTPLADRFDIAAAPCRGFASALRPIETDGAPAAETGGLVWNQGDDDDAPWLLITDQHDVVRGLGQLLAADPASAPRQRRWAGYVTPFEPAERYRVFRIRADGSACPIGQPAAATQPSGPEPAS